MNVKKLCCLSFLGLIFLQSQKNFANDFSETKILKSHMTVIIENQDKIIVQRQEDIVIADESGKELGHESIRETNFIKARKLEAKLFDADGGLLKELDDDEIKESSISYFTVHEEHKTKYYYLTYPVLPYRLSRYTEYEIKSAFFWPDWDPQANIKVEHAVLEVVLKSQVEFSYQAIGDVAEPDMFVDSDGNRRYRWQVKTVPAFESEYRYAPEAAFQIGVKFMPRKFDLDGYHGTNENWQKFGAWCHELFKNQLILSSDITDFGVFASLPSTRERIRQVYRFLQNKTRYVQIYLGVDGWRPHHVDDIHRVKYGDCKDLSVYLIAMLAKAGIPAYPALALTRSRGKVDVDWPGNNFNHCIAEFEGEEPNERTMPLLNLTRATDEDSIMFILPANFKVNGIASTDTVASEFGEFHFYLSLENDRLIWRSRFVLNAREVPLEKYPAYYEFTTAVRRTAAKKLVLKPSRQ